MTQRTVFSCECSEEDYKRLCQSGRANDTPENHGLFGDHLCVTYGNLWLLVSGPQFGNI